MAKLTLGVAGELLSGKSTAATFFVAKYQAKYLKFSKLLSEILDLLGLEHSRVNQQDLAVMLKQIFNQEVLSAALIMKANKVDDNFILFDGIRKPEEVSALKKLPNFKFLFIKSTLENRYKRSQVRIEKIGENQETFEQFKIRQLHDADKQIASLESLADFVVTNDLTLEDFVMQLESLIKGLL